MRYRFLLRADLPAAITRYYPVLGVQRAFRGNGPAIPVKWSRVGAKRRWFFYHPRVDHISQDLQCSVVEHISIISFLHFWEDGGNQTTTMLVFALA
jgi:hypothetical protein